MKRGWVQRADVAVAVRVVGDQLVTDGPDGESVLGSVGDPDLHVLSPVRPRTVLGAMFGKDPTSYMDDPIIPESIRFMMRSPHRRFFFKASAAWGGPDDPIVSPPDTTWLIAEGEIGLVIGRTCHRVGPEEAWDHVEGITIVNDVTAFDYTVQDGDYVRGKGQPGWAPMGPWVLTDVPESALLDGLEVTIRVNGELAQKGLTNELLQAPAQALSYASFITELREGDVVHLGSVVQAQIRPGDLVEIEVDEIGLLANPVVT